MSILPILLFPFGLVLLIKGADFLIDGASSIGKNLGIPEFVIALTIVAFGTSLPELVINILSGLKDSSDIALSNILGSNSANILLILGVSAIVFPLEISKSTVWREIPFGFLAVLVLTVLVGDTFLDNAPIASLSMGDGLVLLSFFVIFLYYTAGSVLEVKGLNEQVRIKEQSTYKSLLFCFFGVIFLGLGGQWTVTGAIKAAQFLKIPQHIIGLTIISIGSSLPELVTSVIAAVKKRPEVAVGNVVGSNIFNIFFVLGVSALISPLNLYTGYFRDLLCVMIATVFLFLTAFTGKRNCLDRWEGVIFLVLFISYLVYRVGGVLVQ